MPTTASSYEVLDGSQRPTNSVVDPSAEDAEIAGIITELFRSARSARTPITEIWDRCYHALRAQGGSTNQNDWRPSVSIPEIYPFVRNSVESKMDQRIITKLSPASRVGSEWSQYLSARSQDLELVMESTAHDNLEEREIERMLYDGDTCGTGIIKTIWDPTLHDGLGDAVLRRINPYYVYPDPSGVDFDDCDYIIEARPMSALQLDRMFPGMGRHFLDGSSTTMEEPPNQLESPRDGRPRHIMSGVSPSTTSWMGSQEDLPLFESAPIVLLEAWIREHSIIETDDPDNPMVRDGWRVIMVANETVLLNESADDVWDYGWHPYDRYVPQELGEFWGLGLVQLLGPLQGLYNRMLRKIVQNIDLTGDPILVEPTNSPSVRSRLAANEPGTRLREKHGQATRWLEPPTLSNESVSLLNFLLSRMQFITGVSDVAQGQSPQGRPAQGVVDSLAESGLLPIRGQLRNLEFALRGSYTKKASLIAENYTESRHVSIVGPSGSQTHKELKARAFQMPTDFAPLEHSIRVDAGSKHHTSRKVREDRVITMKTLEMLDTVTALEWLEVPPDEVAKIMERLGLQQKSILSMGDGGSPGKRERARA